MRRPGTLMLCAVLLFPILSLSQTPPARATRGILTPVGTVNPLRQPLISGSMATAPAHLRPKGTRRIHTPHTALAVPSQAPLVEPAPLDSFRPGRLLRNFNGVSSLDSAVTNFGAEFEPPDQGLCVGNGFVVEPVNSAFSIFRPDGSVIAGPFNVNVLFGEGLREYTSDPRCHFDSATNTWFATILFISSDNSKGRTDIAVNSSGDPTTPWTVYHLDNTDAGGKGTPSHPGCPCFGDQPLLGIDEDNLYISTNEFSILGPRTNGAQIYAIAKRDLVRGLPAHFVHFDNLRIGGTLAFSVQPALTYGDADAEYFLTSLDPYGTFDNRIGVWALTGGESVRFGGTPHLSRLVIASETYGVPPGAVQRGSGSQLDSGDDRMQQVQFMNGSLWGALDTILTPSHDTDVRAGIAWFQIAPQLRHERLMSAEVKRQGYIASSGNYLLYPALQASPFGTAAVVMTLSGASFYPSVAYSVLSPRQRSFGPVKVAALGSGPYDRTATRWGDYSFAVLDPFGGLGFWLATEYIPPVARQTPDRFANWGTRVLEVSALP